MTVLHQLAHLLGWNHVRWFWNDVEGDDRTWIYVRCVECAKEEPLGPIPRP